MTLPILFKRVFGDKVTNHLICPSPSGCFSTETPDQMKTLGILKEMEKIKPEFLKDAFSN